MVRIGGGGSGSSSLLLLLICAVGNDRTTTSATTTFHHHQHGTLTLPLVPHHVHERRLRRERHLAQEQQNLRLVDKDQLDKDDLERHRAHYPKRRNLQADENMQVAALYQGYGTHYADLWCGHPEPQRQTVIVDTGSGVTAFPCSGCTDCGVPKYHIDELYVEAKSDKFSKLTCAECLRGNCKGGSECSIGMSYQEGSSWSAHEVQDLCYVGGFHSKPAIDDTGTKDDLDPHHAAAFAFQLKFGCQTRLTGLFKTQLADGIMGMDNADASYWAQMSKALDVPRKFALCFSRSPIAARDGTEAGAMTLGGLDTRLHATDMLYTPVTQQRGFYNVRLRNVYLRKGGGDSALSDDENAKIVRLDMDEDALNRGGVIVDSGTTDTYFNRGIAGPFKEAWSQLTTEVFDHRGKKFNKAHLAALPTILFQMKGDEELNKAAADSTPGLAAALDPDHPYDVILAVPASHFYEYDADTDEYTARFYTDEGGGSVFGANAMMGHNVYFDVDGFKVGWAESECDYTKLANPFMGDDASEPAETPTEETADETDTTDETDEADATEAASDTTDASDAADGTDATDEATGDESDAADAGEGVTGELSVEVQAQFEEADDFVEPNNSVGGDTDDVGLPEDETVDIDDAVLANMTDDLVRNHFTDDTPTATDDEVPQQVTTDDEGPTDESPAEDDEVDDDDDEALEDDEMEDDDEFDDDDNYEDDDRDDDGKRDDDTAKNEEPAPLEDDTPATDDETAAEQILEDEADEEGESESSAKTETGTTDDYVTSSSTEETGGEEPSEGMCSSTACKGGVAVAALLAAALIGMQIMKRSQQRKRNAIYEVAASELELQGTVMPSATDDMMGGYRDIPQDHDQVNSGVLS